MLTYTILPEHRLKILQYTGVTPLAEWRQSIQNMRADPEYSPEYDVIIDVTGIERHFTRQDLYQMVSYGLPSVKYAIIASSDVSYGIARMFEMISEHAIRAVVRVFRDWDSALKWLGRDPDEFRQSVRELK